MLRVAALEKWLSTGACVITPLDDEPEDDGVIMAPPRTELLDVESRQVEVERREVAGLELSLLGREGDE